MISPFPSGVIIALRLDARGLDGALVWSSSRATLETTCRAGEPPTPQAAVELAAALRTEAEARGLPIRGLALAAAPGNLAAEVFGAVRTGVAVPATLHGLLPAAMRGEQIAGGAQAVVSAVLFDTDRLAAGMMLNGRIVFGAHGRAGDLAHTSVDATGGIRCTCGKVGCLVAVLSAGPEGPRPNLPSFLPAMPSRELGWLALAAIHLINTINPAALIVGGAAVQDEADFAWLAAAAERGCLEPARQGLQRICRARSDNALTGAAADFLAAAGFDSASTPEPDQESNRVQDAVLRP